MHALDLHDTARKRAEIVACIGSQEAEESPVRTEAIAQTLGWDHAEVEGYLRVVEALGWAQEHDGTWQATALGITEARAGFGEEPSAPPGAFSR